MNIVSNKIQEASHCEASCGFEFVPKIIRFMQQFSGQVPNSFRIIKRNYKIVLKINWF